jgi:CheY-like chemotaxis protein
MSANEAVRPAIILLVEDDAGDQEITRRSLAKAKLKNDLFIVEDGEQALDYLFRRGAYTDPAVSPRPDLVLLDLNLPKVDGRQVLEEIRKTPELKRLVVVIMTTSQQEADIVRSYELGVNSYVTKPMDFDQFSKVIQDIGHYWFQVVVLPQEREA